MSENILAQVEQVSFAYKERAILSNLQMQFKKGQVVAIMGGSGSGKTTILRLLGGQILAQQGCVKIAGQDIAKLDTNQLYALRRKMGMLFQHGALLTDLSVFENVAFPLREHTKLPEDLLRDIVLLKLHAVGLRNAAYLNPQQISGGMARRVALARAIVLDPELIMYDEPFAGLDPISMRVIGQLIRKLNDALGSTSIIVSHDVAESFTIADYVYFLANGQIVAKGTPEEMRNSDHPFVKQFVHAQTDGPVAFHYAGNSLLHDLQLEKSALLATKGSQQ